MFRSTNRLLVVWLLSVCVFGGWCYAILAAPGNCD